MGYVIGCYAPANYGKSTTIKSLCHELESMPSQFFEVLYKEEKINSEKDVLRAYRRYGILVFVISGGDEESIISDGYKKLQYACGGLNCDILVCATTQNSHRKTERIRKIETSIENISKQNGHWLEWLDLEKLYDKEDEKNELLINTFSDASKRIIQNTKSRTHSI